MLYNFLDHKIITFYFIGKKIGVRVIILEVFSIRTGFSLKLLLHYCTVWLQSIQMQHGIEGSSKNYWSRGVECIRLRVLPDVKQREVVSHIQHRGTRNF